VAAVQALACLQLPTDVQRLMPLCKNMPGCLTTESNDIVTAINCKNNLVELISGLFSHATLVGQYKSDIIYTLLFLTLHVSAFY
jgi:hypothetical protein